MNIITKILEFISPALKKSRLWKEAFDNYHKFPGGGSFENV